MIALLENWFVVDAILVLLPIIYYYVFIKQKGKRKKKNWLVNLEFTDAHPPNQWNLKAFEMLYC